MVLNPPFSFLGLFVSYTRMARGVLPNRLCICVTDLKETVFIKHLA